MLGLYCNKLYGEMKNMMMETTLEIITENRDGKDNANDTFGSGLDGPVFNPITTPWSLLGLIKEDQAMTETVLQPRITMYLHVGLYIYPIKP